MDIETHTKKVMDNVKTLVETGGGAMDSILQLTVYLTTIDDSAVLRLPLRVYEYGQSGRRDDYRILHTIPRRQIWLGRGIPRRRRGRRPWRDRLAVRKTWAYLVPFNKRCSIGLDKPA